MKTYSPNIVDLSKELVNTILKNEIYSTNSTFLQGMGERKKVLFFLLDGLGSYQLESNEGVLLENRVSDIYTTFPSTTNVVLSSFCTASMPREHGVLSYFMFDQEFGSAFTSFEGKVYPFDRNKDVGEYPYNPNYPTFCSIDFGYRMPAVGWFQYIELMVIGI